MKGLIDTKIKGFTKNHYEFFNLFVFIEGGRLKVRYENGTIVELNEV